MMYLLTPTDWYNYLMGKRIDTDRYPPSQPFQCFDVFDFFCYECDLDFNRKCSITGYAGDMWTLRFTNGASKFFDFVTSGFHNGDWIFWNQHVAMYYDGYQVGQNQGTVTEPNKLHYYVTKKPLNKNGILGAYRLKDWIKYTLMGASDPVLFGHQYHLFKGGNKDFKIGVLSAGLNQLAPITDLDSDDILSYAKITGANYFQNRYNQKDPFGTTYGDISSPLNGVYRMLPNQTTTLFYDTDKGTFGDCTNMMLPESDNVFSPCLVYPNYNGRFEYATMVGTQQITQESIYTFYIEYDDAKCFGITDSKLTPRNIVDDLLTTGFKRIAFLDGGDSAQFGRWNVTKFEYVRKTTRNTPSALTMYKERKHVS